MNLKQAEEFYKQYNGMEFHMSREKLPEYREFCALNIADSVKKQWRCERWNEYYACFPYEDMETAVYIFATLLDFMPPEPEYFSMMKETAERIETLLDSRQAGYVVHEIVGKNAYKGHGGLIELCCKNGCKDMAEDLIRLAIRLIDKAAEDSDIYLLSVRSYLVDVCELYGLELCNNTKKKLIRENGEHLFKYYYRGAQEGNGFAMGELGKYYRDGIGCEKNLDLAKMWMERAYEKGNKMIYPYLRELIT